MGLFDNIRDAINRGSSSGKTSTQPKNPSIGGVIGGLIGGGLTGNPTIGAGIGTVIDRISGGSGTRTAQENELPTDPTSDYINDLKEAQRRSRIAALDTAKTNALSALDTEQASVEPIYYDKRNQVAARSDVGAMNFANYMASRGIKGSAGAMPEIYRQAGLQGQIGALDQAEAQDLSNIERQRGLINSNYEFDVAQANADIESQAMQNLIDQYNRNRDYNLQLGGLTGTVNGTPTLAQRQMETQATGYYNPWAAYALNDDINNQLAPYMNNLQAFIDENPTSSLVPYAQNARFQKIASDPTLREKYGQQYQTVEGMNASLRNKAQELENKTLEIENSMLPETLKLQVERLKQQVKVGLLDYDKALAEIDHIKRQTANIGASTALGWAELNQRNQENANETITDAYNDAIKNIESLYVYNDTYTGTPTINKTGLRQYILSLNLPDTQTTSLLTRYGV